MRLVDEAFQVLGMPMVAARLFLVAVHALLHDRPVAIVGHEESVEVEIEAVLDGGAVDFGDQTACAGEPGAVETHAFAQQVQFVRRLPRMLSPPAADMDAEFVRKRSQPALEGTDNAGGDPDECQSMPMTAPNDWNQNG